MPKIYKTVINTGPILALLAGFGNLNLLKSLYDQVVVPYEVCEEIMAGGLTGFGVREFNEAEFLVKIQIPTIIQPYLRNSLDLGEASVIQTAINEKIRTVCIDESVGRRIARLNGLALTGSLGIMIRAKKEGHTFLLREIIARMQAQGIHLSDKLMAFALKQVSE